MPTDDDATTADPLLDSFGVLSAFLGENTLTSRIATVESELQCATPTQAAAAAAAHGLSSDLLSAALTVRSRIGRLNDVIHATTIALALPHILDPNEHLVNRPSLGAGNDPSRPFDLETNRRIAEFKAAEWKGKDTMRKRGVFADLVHLALDDSGRRAQLYVVGELPARFLRNSTSTASWALGRSSPHTRQRFTDAYDPDATMTVAEFTNGPAAHIEIIDLTEIVPALRQGR